MTKRTHVARAATTPQSQHITRQSQGGVLTEPLSIVIDSEAFTPRLLAVLSNALVWRESILMRNQFDLGTNDWRVISALAIKPGSTATEVTEYLPMNKAAVSKAVNTLISRKLIASEEGPRGSRRLFLTEAGGHMHDNMIPVSLSGEELLLSQLKRDEVRQLRALLKKMVATIDVLDPS